VLLITDISYSGDLLFFTPPPTLVLLLLLLGVWFLAATITSVFLKRFIIPIGILLLARGAIGFPLNGFLENNAACLLVDGLLVLILLCYFVFSILPSLKLFKNRKLVSLKHSIVMITMGICLAVASIPMMIGGLAKGFGNVVGDYTRISLSSISMVERIFEKDGVKVFLVGMMHVGEPEFYQQLNEKMAAPIEGKRAILMEGVLDETNILPTNFKEGQTYGSLAESLGLVVQGMGEENMDPNANKKGWVKGNVEYINADIDVSEFSPEHQSLLVEMLSMMGKGMLTATPSADFTPENLEDLFVEGLLKFRNDRVMEKFDEVIDRGGFQEIYIPWGAAHLGDIEERIKGMGYTEVSEKISPSFRFWK